MLWDFSEYRDAHISEVLIRGVPLYMYLLIPLYDLHYDGYTIILHNYNITYIYLVALSEPYISHVHYDEVV